MTKKVSVGQSDWKNQRTFTGEHLAQVAFPVGGIGTGTISLGGRGNLQDWEIFGRPGKGVNLPMTFFAIRAEAKNVPPVSKILERRFLPPFTGAGGFDRSNLSGLPRLAEATFCGQYPFARIAFQDDDLPLAVSLEAFNPFIPLNVEDSSIPAAVFNWRFKNLSDGPVQLSLLASMTNPVMFQSTDCGCQGECSTPTFVNEYREEAGFRGLYFSSTGLADEDMNLLTAALTTPHKELDVQTRLYRGKHPFDNSHILWDTFTSTGRLPNVRDRTQHATRETGALSLQAELDAGEEQTFTCMISWHKPQLAAWTDNIPARTYMSSQFADAWHAGRYAWENMKRLRTESDTWRETIFSSSLPAEVIDAAASQASIIRTQTCLRLADGQFYAYEGCNDTAGCCTGSCTHVWNYEQSLAFLFPELERSIRRNEFLNSTSWDGKMAFRSSMPANTKLEQWHPAGDGQMGAVIRAYRDWQFSGNDEFLREIWPKIKKALEFAWTEPNGWDPNKDGVMEGCQHNTYDIEFYGPNTMMGAIYLGALRAAEEMANYLGEKETAEEYRAVYESGRKRTDDELFNGEYYIQKVEVMNGLTVPDNLKVPLNDPYQPIDSGQSTAEVNGDSEIKYQYGNGCLADQLLGQWACHVAGLGYVLDKEHVRKSVESIHRYNYRPSLLAHPNVQRVYALGDEAGLLICTWPKGGRPRIPFIYADEAWTGIEYQAAAHMIYEGLVEEGVQVVKAVRDRHDGKRRNPWDEFECGHHYARALSSWSLITALSGFSGSAVEKRLGFAPRICADDFRCFYSTADSWGFYRQQFAEGKFTAAIRVLHGRQTLKRLQLEWPEECVPAHPDCQTSLDGKSLSCVPTQSGRTLSVELDHPIEIKAGSYFCATCGART